MRYFLSCFLGVWFSIAILIFTIYFGQDNPPRIFGFWVGLSFLLFYFLSSGLIRKHLNLNS